jgi:hypothetical protein
MSGLDAPEPSIWRVAGLKREHVLAIASAI